MSAPVRAGEVFAGPDDPGSGVPPGLVALRHVVADRLGGAGRRLVQAGTGKTRMSQEKVLEEAPGVGRLGIAAAWTAAICCVPYLTLKALWTFDIPVGIDDQSVLHESGWVAGNALMALVQLVGLLLVLTLIRPWSQRLPAWLLLVPAWVGTGLLFQVAVGAVLVPLLATVAPAPTESTGGIASWVFVTVYASFAGQGAALAIAFACYVRARWGALLGTRTDAVATGGIVRRRSWLESHLPELALAVAGLTFVVTVVCGFWAAGGSFGPSRVLPDPPRALQAARLAGAITATLGLLGLAGRWGRGRTLWVPVTLTWIGSGAVVAFDGLAALLFLLLPPEAAEGGWGLTDTAVLIKVAVGLLAAAVALLAVGTAAHDRAALSTRGTDRAEPTRAATPR